ncbi:MAG: hypothetical protein LBB26_01480 [Puniceicoccales bacterium]|nr:hypothetical protein [Puniceicoccales bacterium]
MVATSERERRTFSRKPLPDLACAHVDACWGVLRNSNLGGDAISVLGNFSDAQKCDFVKKSGVQILETLNSPANPALLAAVIDLLIALPDGLLGRIKSLFTGRRAPSEVEEALRCHVESELVDGFSRFPEWAFTLFIFDNANMFVTLFNSDMRVAKL